MGTSVSLCSVCRCGSGAQVNHPGKGREKHPWVGFFSSEVCSELGSEILPLSVPHHGEGKFCTLTGGEAIFSAFVHPHFQEQSVLAVSVSQPSGSWYGLRDLGFLPGAICFCREGPECLEAFIKHLHWPLEGEGKLEDL